MYKYGFFRKTYAEIQIGQRIKTVNKIAELLLKGHSQQKIAEKLNLSTSNVRFLMTDIDEETLREALWV